MGAMNTGSEGLRDSLVASTSLTHIDGEWGLLQVAGYSVEEIAPRCSFRGGMLPAVPPLAARYGRGGTLRRRPRTGRALPAGLWAAARQAAADRVAPMDALMILAALLRRPGRDPHPLEIVAGLMMAAGCYPRLLAGADLVTRPSGASHVEAYLHLGSGRVPHPAAVRALETYLVTVMDHRLNASTFAAQVAASTHADLLSCTVAGLAALKGVARQSG